MTIVYCCLGTALVAYCWYALGIVGLLGSCVLLALNEWVRRTGGYT